MSAYRRDFNETKYMSLFIKDNDLLEKYNEIWEKVKNNMKNELDSEPVYNKKYMTIKIKSYNEKINTNFPNNKILKGGSQCIYLSVILIDTVFIKGKNYYPRVFLECKILLKRKKCLIILLMT